MSSTYNVFIEMLAFDEPLLKEIQTIEKGIV